MVWPSEIDVCNCLSYHNWKSPREIRDDLRVMYGIKDPLKSNSAFMLGMRMMFKDISFPPIYMHLAALEEQDFAESRERELSQRRRLMRSGHAEREYHLTTGGIRHKDRCRSRERTPAVEEISVPA